MRVAVVILVAVLFLFVLVCAVTGSLRGKPTSKDDDASGS
jgi:hypothetical protein